MDADSEAHVRLCQRGQHQGVSSGISRGTRVSRVLRRQVGSAAAGDSQALVVHRTRAPVDPAQIRSPCRPQACLQHIIGRTVLPCRFRSARRVFGEGHQDALRNIMQQEHADILALAAPGSKVRGRQGRSWAPVEGARNAKRLRGLCSSPGAKQEQQERGCTKTSWRLRRLA